MKTKLSIVFFSLLLLLIASPVKFNTNSAQAQIDCSGGSSIFRSDGLISATDIVGIFNTELGKCVVDPNASLKKPLIPSYAELKINHFDKIKNGPGIKKKMLTGDVNINPTPPHPIRISTGSNGDNVYHIQNGNLNIASNIEVEDIGVIFVDKNLNINPSGNELTHTTNTGGLVFIVKGDVNIAKEVTRVDAVIIAEGNICTAWDTSTSSCPTIVTTEQLVVNGSLISINKAASSAIKFNRRLDNNTDEPSEDIVTQPKYLAILKDILSVTSQQWSEIAGPIVAGITPSSAPQPSPISGSSPPPSPVSGAVRVFVTSTTHKGGFGGLTAADNICQTRANLLSLGGSWKAWLSDSTASPSNRFSAFAKQGPYRLLDGTLIANSWADLTDGTLQNPINKTELKTTYNGSVWTNTLANGTIKSNNTFNNCNNWTSPPADCTGPYPPPECSTNRTGYAGNSNEKSGSLWTLTTFTSGTPPYLSTSATLSCASSASFYCFAQDPAPTTPPPPSSPPPASIPVANSYRIFVSSQEYSGGELGGLNGADAKCQTLAHTAGLGGSWKAWLSDTVLSAADRLSQNTKPLVLVDKTTKIANSWSDLVDGKLAAKIDRDENGNLKSNEFVWTNTKADGSIAITNEEQNCRNWTSNFGSGPYFNEATGLTGNNNSSIDPTWTIYTSSKCIEKKPLYCVEQPTGTPLRAFVTSSAYNGNLGGLWGADNMCQQSASNAKIGGVWKAWIAGNNIDTYLSNNPFVSLDNKIIGYNWADLNDNSFSNPISINENKVAQTGFAWTGDSTNSCTDWTSASSTKVVCSGPYNCTTVPQDAIVGNITRTDSQALNAAKSICNSSQRLYCLEVPPGSVDPPKRVFISSGTYKAGDLNGLNGADAICQGLAGTQGLGGKWRAWLSTTNIPAKFRLQHNKGAYKLLDGTIIAQDWNDLTDGSIKVPILMDEKKNKIEIPFHMVVGPYDPPPGKKVFDPVKVWTNTNHESQVAYTLNSCNGWTSNSGTGGSLGDAAKTDSNWSTYVTNQACNGAAHLYCIEQ